MCKTNKPTCAKYSIKKYVLVAAVFLSLINFWINDIVDNGRFDRSQCGKEWRPTTWGRSHYRVQSVRGKACWTERSVTEADAQKPGSTTLVIDIETNNILKSPTWETVKRVKENIKGIRQLLLTLVRYCDQSIAYADEIKKCLYLRYAVKQVNKVYRRLTRFLF